jgi:hypothetical protein
MPSEETKRRIREKDRRDRRHSELVGRAEHVDIRIEPQLSWSAILKNCAAGKNASEKLKQERALEYIRDRLISFDKRSIVGVSDYRPAKKRLNERIEEEIRRVYGRCLGMRKA